MKQIFAGTTLLALFTMAASSQVMAEKDYEVSFKDVAQSVKYVKQLSAPCMHEPKGNPVYKVPYLGQTGPIKLRDSNNIGGNCVNGAKEVNWAVGTDPNNLNNTVVTFRHYKNNGTWYTKISTLSGVATATCNGRPCSDVGTPGVSTEPSPIVIKLF
ncbi:hypothetical protein D3C85_927150 [compost metagenome]